jgi:hypothetical protein
VAETVRQIIISGVLGGLLVSAVNLVLEKRGLRKAQSMKKSAAAAMERAAALMEELEAAAEKNAAVAETLRRNNALASRISRYEVLSANMSSLHSCSRILEIRLQSRTPESAGPAYAEFEDCWEKMQPGYARARAGAGSSANAENEIAAVDAVETAANALHTAVADWYRQLEAAGWPADPPRPAADLASARIACFQATRELSRLAVEGPAD